MTAKQASKRLVPFAKISDEALDLTIRGFCRAQRVDEIAAASGLSEKTCRSVILALRSRLLGEPFDLWRGAFHWRTSLEPETSVIAQATVFGCLATCYFKRSCYTNFQQGRRSSRLCRSCLIPALEMGADYDEAALYHIDLIHGFYAVLGIGAETGIGKLSLFRLRLAHMQVVGEACEATRRGSDGLPNMRQHGPLTVRTLYARLITDLENEPLNHAAIHTDPEIERFEDLSFLK